MNFKRTVKMYAFSCLGLIVLWILANLLIPPWWGFDGAPKRSLVARVRSDLRTLATALESYYIDTNEYPAWSVDQSQNAFAGLKGKKLEKQPTFASISATVSKTLTTPVAYLTSHAVDPFSPVKRATWCYWTMREGSTPESKWSSWIAWSAGPDKRYDITIDNVAALYDPRDRTPSEELINLTYDPTNGMKSAGDVWRYKE